ncbi:diaminopimelate epimerase [Christiangramia forsetii]|uniref:Diaminopimelate epimerase n=2 Tax=Christiangramia forsetii TaxID=411153 RepID=A0LZ07_CHRFK|nr:diaminopimelate epimerase [Christiangramia forsetii]GGG37098.1 diaminopimelate epimerase [Christiangramia forsetii]CAL65602.1 diaminopimelate epimerase [Christiangramia forsetii KT0803]
MKLKFYKYQGTGNDFVMIDNRDKEVSKNDTKLINHLCDRKFGIGADGLILLENSEDPEDDFKMVYFNADGNESSMCGNGGRCLVAFANFLGIIKDSARFTAIDGVHKASIEGDVVSLKMQNVESISENEDFIFLDTGSPHHILFTENVNKVDIKKEGSAIRYSERYKANNGTNVNFVEAIAKDTFSVRTYERGVEDETLSCGTGVTAVALAAFKSSKTNSNKVKLVTPGGKLSVSFKETEKGFSDVWLSGPAEFVFKGEIVC